MTRFVQEDFKKPAKEKKDKPLPKPGAYTSKVLEATKPLPFLSGKS